MGGTALLLHEADREPALVRRIASSPSVEAHLSKRARLILPWELGRLAEPIQSCGMDESEQRALYRRRHLLYLAEEQRRR